MKKKKIKNHRYVTGHALVTSYITLRANVTKGKLERSRVVRRLAFLFKSIMKFQLFSLYFKSHYRTTEPG